MHPKFRNALPTTLALATCAACMSCERTEPAQQRPATSANRLGKAAASAADLLTQVPKSSAPVVSKEVEEPSEQLVSATRKRPLAPRIGKHRVVQDELVDVSPAGPSAATSVGVLLVARDSSTHLARLKPGPSNSTTPIATPIVPLDALPSAFVALERGPAVSNGSAYFVHAGRLLRKTLNQGALETIADDARPFTRVAVPDIPLPELPAVVAYIARHASDKETLIAKLWVEGQGTFVLTPDGSSGNSVALTRAGDGYIAMSLESRTGMSPLHARRVTFEGGQVKLGNDVIPWVAGTAQPLSEVRAVADPWSVWALLPMERDATRFGLARVELGFTPHMGANVFWREYPNGVEPAVVTSGYLCHRPVVLYARPANAEPHSPQELHLSSIGSDGLGPSTVIASSRAFADASFASLDWGGLVVYVADRRTWAKRLRCVP